MCPYITSRIGLPTISSKDKFEIPTSDILYGQFDDETTLRAFKILSVLYGDGKDKTFLRVDVAGLGEGYVSADGVYYDSKEDYVRKVRSTRVLTGTYYSALDKIRTQLDGLGTLVLRRGWGDYMLYRYAWRNNGAESTSVKLYAEYDVETGELTLATGHRGDYPYTSEEACILDNQVDVVEFDGAQKPEQKEFVVDLPKQVKVTARTEDEARQKVQNGLESIIK